MAFARGRFGIEYNTARRDDDSSGLLPVALGVVFLLAFVSLVSTVVSRVRASRAERAEAVVEVGAERLARAAAPAEPVPAVEMPPPEKLDTDGATRRPAKVRNLILRLEAAERNGDMAMAISTIEQIRSLPGNPAADLDNALAKRLGVLNMRLLFGGGPSPWTTEVSVRFGENASRIAHEHGSTLASLRRLNGGQLEKLQVGKKLKVMDHPRFSLAVHRRQRTADLSLNGKFFKRYYLLADVTGEDGAYETTDGLRNILQSKGIVLGGSDREELETLLPRGVPVLIAEF